VPVALLGFLVTLSLPCRGNRLAKGALTKVLASPKRLPDSSPKARLNQHRQVDRRLVIGRRNDEDDVDDE
jgi:hypothetical protein